MTGMFSLELAVGAVGAAILHSLWQGALIAVLTAVAFLAFRGAIPGTATGPHIHIGRPSHRY